MAPRALPTVGPLPCGSPKHLTCASHGLLTQASTPTPRYLPENVISLGFWKTVHSTTYVKHH